MQTIERDGVRIAYRTEGSADPARPWLVFSHSLACDHTMWDPQMDAFADFRILRFDTRGMGSRAPPRATTRSNTSPTI